MCSLKNSRLVQVVGFLHLNWNVDSLHDILLRQEEKMRQLNYIDTRFIEINLLIGS